MDPNVQKERFSLSYIQAVAACAGYQMEELKVDRDSIDGVLIADFGMRPRLEFQAKATSRDIVRGNTIHYPLPIKNYDDLRLDAINPRILIVLLMPELVQEWINLTAEELCLRHCAYWLSLEGRPETVNISNVTVEVPLANRFDVEQLREMMEKTAMGGAPC